MPVAMRISVNFKSQQRKAGKPLNMGMIRAAEKVALKEAKTLALSLYAKTTRTWVTPTKFSARKTTKGLSILVNNKNYIYIDRGTSVRYATMTKGFKAKTKVGVLYSYQGAGRVAFVNKAKPKPGIQARGFTVKIDKAVTKKIRQVYFQYLRTRWRS